MCPSCSMCVCVCLPCTVFIIYWTEVCLYSRVLVWHFACYKQWKVHLIEEVAFYFNDLGEFIREQFSCTAKGTEVRLWCFHTPLPSTGFYLLPCVCILYICSLPLPHDMNVKMSFCTKRSTISVKWWQLLQWMVEQTLCRIHTDSNNCRL